MKPGLTISEILLKNERVELRCLPGHISVKIIPSDVVLTLGLDGKISDNQGFEFFSIALQSIAGSIFDCTFEGQARDYFLEAKALELMALYLVAVGQPRQNYKHCKSEYDRERLFFAKTYLTQHYDLPPTIAELSRIAGINQFKLKNGFKELFGETIHDFVNNHRLDLALQMLLKGDKNAGQSAFELGFSSLQHFSKAFRQKFGYPPSQVKGVRSEG